MSNTKNQSIVKKILSFTISNIICIGIVLMGFGYFLQSSILKKSFLSQATSITQQWASKLNINDVENAKNAQNYDDPAQQKLTEYFDLLSQYNPNIAQGYIYGAELKNGNQTSVIAFPTHVINDFKKVGLKVGDMYEQPSEITKSIEKMLKTKEVTSSSIYKDDFGTWVSILYPLKDSTGKISSYFAVDVDASSISKGQSSYILYSSFFILLIIAIMSLLQGIFIKKTLLPLKDLVQGIDKLSNGNFDFELQGGNDELGLVNTKFNSMTAQIKEMILKIKETSHNVDQFSKELLCIAEENNEHSTTISKDIQEMDSGIKAQEASIITGSQSMSEIALGVKVIADNSLTVSSSAANVESKSLDGNNSMNNVLSQMNLISKAMNDSADVIKNLNEHSKEISMITDVITQISNQTDLLALNAAIEAARAGEFGTGFAVVADEIRKLADQSKNSAEQIVKLIQVIQTETANAVNSMDKGTKEVQNGIDIAKETGSLFLDIENTIKEISSQTQEVSGSSQRISTSAEEMSSTINNLTSSATLISSKFDNITNSIESQQHSTTSIVDTSKQLNNLSEELQNLISQFQI